MSKFNIPSELLYTKDHEWLRKDKGYAYIGISDFAQDSLGDIIFVECDYAIGAVVEGESVFGTVEAVKTVSDLIMPITGKIVEINQDIYNNPEKINESPYDSWIIKIEINSENELKRLLNKEEYLKLIE